MLRPINVLTIISSPTVQSISERTEEPRIGRTINLISYLMEKLESSIPVVHVRLFLHFAYRFNQS